MKKRCVFALPLLLAGCGDDLARYQGRADFDLVRLAPSHIGHWQEQTSTRDAVVNAVQALAQFDATVKMASPQEKAPTRVVAAHQHHDNISVIRTQLAEAESRRQSGERQLQRLNDMHWRHGVSASEIEQQKTIVRAEAVRVAELRAALKSARLSVHTAQGPRQTASAEYHASRNTGLSAG